MRIVIIEQGQREYLLNTFAQHPEFEAEISCFAEWIPKTQAYDGDIPVIPLSELKKEHYDAVLIAVKWNHHLSQLLTYLHDEAVANIYVIRLFALDTQADFIAGANFDMTCVDKIPEGNENPYLVHLETHVCDHCNLNCKACNNFSPFVNERCVTNLANFKKDMEHLSGLFSNIGRLFLLGGEPMLEPDISCEMIKISRRYFPNSELRLLTNGTLITKMSSDFWNCLREYRVIIHISVYPPIIEKLDEIEKILKDNKIVYLLAKRVEKFGKRWTLYPFEDAEFNNKKCGSAGCHYLRNGVLSKCPDGILIGKMANQLNCEPEALMDRSSINLCEANDAWDILRKLNDPCDLCKRCTHHRLEWIPWGSAGTSPDPADWIVENRLEYENRQLQVKIARSEEKLQDIRHELRYTEHKLKNTEKRLQNVNRRFDKLRNEYEAMRRSLSFRLGRALTWLPRKLRQIKRFTIFEILKHFRNDVMNGYHHYSQMMKKYGYDAQIYKTSGGTGDIYIAGLYFKEYLRVHNIQRKPVFTVIRQGGYSVAQLFEFENIELISYENRKSMVHFGIFIGFHNIHFTILHHAPNSLYTSIAAKMEVVHDMTFLDVQRYTIYGGINPTGIPAFDNNKNEVEKIFNEHMLCPGKTIVLAPYSVSMQAIPVKFWEDITDKLLEKGYTVCTNSQDEREAPIRGTIAIEIPIKLFVPFLNTAGFLIGVRSGIIDVSESAKIKRVIIYSKIAGGKYRGHGGHNNNFYQHFSFNKYWGRSDALEIEYYDNQKTEYIEEIFEYLEST